MPDFKKSNIPDGPRNGEDVSWDGVVGARKPAIVQAMPADSAERKIIGSV